MVARSHAGGHGAAVAETTDDREQRLAAALRENLRKRKAQTRDQRQRGSIDERDK